jgi:CDP-diacylglycerol--glycerol-3-phosphate 3-phosphatidyltransferase
MVSPRQLAQRNGTEAVPYRVRGLGSTPSRDESLAARYDSVEALAAARLAIFAIWNVPMGVSTDESTQTHARARVLFNVPNQLTTLRLLLSIALFVLIELGARLNAPGYYLAAMVVFIIAAGTDWLDGYWARKYGQVTTLGRILDPFVDKVIICGTFILLAALPTSGLAAWMAVVVVARELLVTALRSFLEGEGIDFSAAMSGKLKMVAQCLAAGWSLYRLSYGNAPAPDWVTNGLVIVVWAAVVLTVYSGVEYVIAAIRLLRRS